MYYTKVFKDTQHSLERLLDPYNFLLKNYCHSLLMYLFIEALLVGRGGQNVTPLLSVQAGGRGQQGRPETHTFCDVTLCDIYVLKMFRSVTLTLFDV